MEKLGIIGAEEQEIDLLKPFFVGNRFERAGLTVYDGTIFGKPVSFVRSGIGKVSAALCTQMLISEYGVTALVNSGIAGNLSKDLGILDIVIAEKAIQYDVDVTFWNYTRGQIPGTESPFWHADPSLIQAITDSFYTIREKGLLFYNSQTIPDTKAYHTEHTELLSDICQSHLCTGIVATGDTFVSTEAHRKAVLSAVPDALCVEMEGAAIAQVATVNRIPFAVLRSISDNSDEAEKETSIDYEVFSKRAAKMATSILLQLIYENR